MRRRWAVGGGLAVLAAALWLMTRAPSPPQPPAPAPRTTPAGETLPPFARARLGPAPEPGLWSAVGVTADGRTALVGRGAWGVSAIDVATRAATPRFDVEPWEPGQRRITRRGALGMEIVLAEEDAAPWVGRCVWSDGAKRLAVGVMREFRTRQASSVEIRVIDAATGDPVMVASGFGARVVHDVALSRDGSLVAVAWDGAGGPPGASWHVGWRPVDANEALHEVGSGQFTGVAFAPDGSSLAALGAALVVFDLPSGAARFATPARTDASLNAVAWSPDGARIAHAEGKDGDVVLRDAKDGREVWRHAGPGEYQWPNALAWSPDGGHVAVCGWRTTVVVLDGATGAAVATLPCGALHAAFTPDGGCLVVAAGALRVFDTTTWAEIDAPPPGPSRLNAVALAWAPDAAFVVTGDGAGNVRTWDAATGAPRASARPAEARVADLAVSPDGATVAAVLVPLPTAAAPPSPPVPAPDGTLVLLDAATLSERSRSAVSPRASIAWRGASLVRLEPRADGALVETDCATGATTDRGQIGTDPWVRADLADGGALAVLRGKPSNRVVEIATGRVVTGTTPGEPSLNVARFSPDSATVLTAAVGGNGRHVFSGLRLLDAATGRVRFEIEPDMVDTNATFDVAPGGDLIAWSAWDSAVELWHVPSGERAARFVGTKARVTLLSFSPDGATLAAASADGSVVLWDVSGFR